MNADELEENEVGIGGTITRNTQTGEIHIGENSLITNEVAGVQELYAQDGTGDAINIDVTNGSDLLIDGVSVATDADVAANTVSIEKLNGNDQEVGSVDFKIAQAMNADELEENEVGIGGTITRNTQTGEIHIGENSLITNEVAGVQELYAQDGTGDAINIDVTNGSDLLIDGVSVATDADVAAEVIARSEADAALQTQIDVNRADIDRNARGIAMVAALTHTTVLPGMTHALDISAAHFEGETGMAVSYSRRVKEGVQINFGAASTTDFDESVVRAGIGYQW